jgi:hypothetical protein
MLVKTPKSARRTTPKPPNQESKDLQNKMLYEIPLRSVIVVSPVVVVADTDSKTESRPPIFSMKIKGIAASKLKIIQKTTVTMVAWVIENEISLFSGFIFDFIKYPIIMVIRKQNKYTKKCCLGSL